MSFWPKGRYRIKQTFAVAAMGGTAAALVLNSPLATRASLAFATLVLAGLHCAFKLGGTKDSIKYQTSPVSVMDKELRESIHRLSEKSAAKSLNFRYSGDVRVAGASLENTILLDPDYFGSRAALTPGQQEAVLAHEIGHVKNRDMYSSFEMTPLNSLCHAAFFTQTVSTVIFSGTQKQMLAAALFTAAYHALKNYQNKQQEYDADRTAALLTSTPLDLASALKKAAGNLGLALSSSPLRSLVNGYPSMQSRIEKLEYLHRRMQERLAP